MNNPYLIHGLTVGPITVRRLVEAIGVEQADVLADPERFTLRESVAHLADWEKIDLDRIRQAIAQPGSTLQPYDESQRAIDENYAGADILSHLDLYASRRAETIAFLQSLTEDQWKAVAFHPEKGSLTVYDQANLILGHDTYHVEHLTQFL
ncbi:MAG: DinB family protein [Armatimonadetes bacterium]|nr:DinB family protein [Armatimonadota bacterium]